MSERVNSVPGNSHQRFDTFKDALELYTRKYKEGAVRVVVVPGSRFIADSPASSTSSDSTKLWLALEDLSVEMNSVQL